VRSGPGAARTILLLHIISARPSKQPRMVRTFLKVYMELGSYFLFLQEQIKDIIIITEEVAKEISDIACLGARRLVVRLERIFTLAQVLVVGLVAGYGRRATRGPPSGLGGAIIGEHRQFV
jgi:hypothetical protein